MGVVLESVWTEVLFCLLIALWWLYHHLTKDYGFWERQGVPFVKPVLPYGSLPNLALQKEHLGKAFDQVYKQFPNERYCGVIHLNRPVLVLRDPEIIKDVLVKEFNSFVDRAAFEEKNPREAIAHHLFQLDGEIWRRMRHRLTPAFSSGKMKLMFHMMLKCGDQLAECLEDLGNRKGIVSVDVKEMFAKFTMDIIASCAFGLELNSLKDENSKFYRDGTEIFRPSTFLTLKRMFIFLFPALGTLMNVSRFEKSTKEMIYSLVINTAKHREESNVTRKDFMDILINLKNNKSIMDGSEMKEDFLELDDKFEGKEEMRPAQTSFEGLTIDEMVAQSFIFFAAGFETAASTMTFCLHELSRHPEVQQRLWREVREAIDRHGGRLTYQALQEMTYMDQVINETLRMYASVSVLHRRCTRPYRVPGSDLVLRPGQRVVVPTYAIHHDPLHYPDPLRFDPERFNADNSRGRHPCLHLPFGTGPRNCIGMRFGLMQTKVGLSTLMSRFEVWPGPGARHPIRLLASSFVTQPDSPVRLGIRLRNSGDGESDNRETEATPKNDDAAS